MIHSFTKVALNANTQFFGNVAIGKDVTLAELRQAYNAVVLCYGSSQDTLLNIPGEDVDNVVSARRFVGWYNGIPQDKDLSVSLDCETAVIIGQGNVALDCARILLLSPAALKTTDITNHSFRKLSQSRLKKIYIVGRRGPMQAAFKIKEFRELTKMDDCTVKIIWTEQDKQRLDFDRVLQVCCFEKCFVIQLTLATLSRMPTSHVLGSASPNFTSGLLRNPTRRINIPKNACWSSSVRPLRLYPMSEQIE